MNEVEAMCKSSRLHINLNGSKIKQTHPVVFVLLYLSSTELSVSTACNLFSSIDSDKNRRLHSLRTWTWWFFIYLFIYFTWFDLFRCNFVRLFSHLFFDEGNRLRCLNVNIQKRFRCLGSVKKNLYKITFFASSLSIVSIFFFSFRFIWFDILHKVQLRRLHSIQDFIDYVRQFRTTTCVW